MNKALSLTDEPIGSLQPNPWNTNRITDPANEEKLRESLKRFGAFKPVLVRTLKNGALQILGGEHRWKAAKQLGWKSIPVINLGEISDSRAKEIGLVDNGRYGEDDAIGLASLLKELGGDVTAFMPFSQSEMDSIVQAAEAALDDLDAKTDADIEDLSQVRAAPAYQVMRFKVPVEDVAWISVLIENTMKREGMTSEDSLTNAGGAFVSLMKKVEKGLKV